MVYWHLFLSRYVLTFHSNRILIPLALKKWDPIQINGSGSATLIHIWQTDEKDNTYNDCSIISKLEDSDDSEVGNVAPIDSLSSFSFTFYFFF